MLKSVREKNILKQGLIVLGIMIGLYLFLINPFLKEGKNIMDEELDRKTIEIKRYITRTGSLPSKDSFLKLEKEKVGLEKKFSELLDFIDPEKTRIGKDSSEAGLYFIERLHSTIKKFEILTTSKGIKLPENLGFGDGLPKENMVDIFLRQLETMELALDILLNSEKIEVSALKPLKAIEYVQPLTKELFYTELPVQISIKTDNKTLIKFLAKFKDTSPVVSVKELHIKSNDVSGDIEASLVMSSFMVKRPSES